MRKRELPLVAITFDVGDTLIDLGEGRGDYESRVLMRAGRVYDTLAGKGLTLPERSLFCQELARGSESCYQAALAELRGIDIGDVMRWFLPAMGIPVDDQLIKVSSQAFYHDSVDGPPLRTGALAVLTELRHRGHPLGVISNTLQPGRVADAGLARRGLLDFFAVRIYSSEARVAKPHAAIFHAALETLGATPERAVHVGDRIVADVQGAQKTGMKGVLIRASHRSEPITDIRPDACIAELPELLDVLPELMAQE